MMYLVTVTVPGTVGHDPKNKVTGPCPVSGETCTDITGKHHTFLVESSLDRESVREAYEFKYGHVTRIEEARMEYLA